MKISDSYEDHGIHSKIERYSWAGYLLFVLISSLIGDTIILLASTRYQALRLNKCVVVVLQHIAVCDIVACWGYVIPTLVSLLSDRWILGDHIAHLHLYLDYMSSQANSFFTCFLACCKVFILKYPLRTKTWSKKGVHTACFIIWISANIYPILRFILDTDGLVFSYISYNINYGLSSNSSNLKRITAYTFSILTKDVLTLTILLATLYIILYLRRSRAAARKSGGTVRWQGICTVFVTSSVYCSTVILNRIGYYTAITVKSRGYKESQFNRATEILSTVNIMSNFYIYCLTVPSFRTFIKTKIVELIPGFRKFSHNVGRQKDEVELCQKIESQAGDTLSPSKTQRTFVQNMVIQ